MSTDTLSFAPPRETGLMSIIGHSPAMQEILRILARVIEVDLSVLITGESGTGKELAARALHALGPRKHKPFIALNIAAIARDGVEGELFGHQGDSFNRKTGKLEQAEDGILFLEEIDLIPPGAQTSLLCVLQQGEYRPVGSTAVMQSNARIISTTRADIAQMVSAGTFSKDLYCRLNVAQMRMPPLRERKEDITALITYFLAKAETQGMPRKIIAFDALPHFERHGWPGNVRELENLIYRLITLYSDTVINAEAVCKELHIAPSLPVLKTESLLLSDIVHQHVSAYFKNHAPSLPSPGLYDRLMPLFEKPLIEVTLEATGGNQFKAAAILGINRNTLRKKINAHGIETVRK